MTKVSELPQDFNPTPDDYVLSVDNLSQQSKKITIYDLVVNSGATAATPAGLVDLATSQTITGVKTFTANPVLNSNAIPESAVTNLTTDLAAKATDTAAVHLAGAETITGAKTFNANLIANANVGIGTAAPASNLSIAATSVPALTFFETGNSTVIGKFDVYNSKIRIGQLSTSDIIVIDLPTKNVGIGTTAPGAQLVIATTQPDALVHTWLTFRNLSAGFGTWGFVKASSNDLSLNYSANNIDNPSNVAMTFQYGGNVSFSNLILPQQATTAAAPAYVKGAIYFDTTLNKLRVGGATAWETITSS